MKLIVNNNNKKYKIKIDKNNAINKNRLVKKYLL